MKKGKLTYSHYLALREFLRNSFIESAYMAKDMFSLDELKDILDELYFSLNSVENEIK